MSANINNTEQNDLEKKLDTNNEEAIIVNQPIDWGKLINIKISKNKLEAYIIIDNFCEEKSVDIEIIKKLLEKSKVVFGIDSDKLMDIANNIQLYKGEQILVAKGKAATDGIDGYIELIRDNYEENSSPIVLKDGRVDFFNIKEIPSVLKGEEIARKIEPVLGESGMDIHGVELKAKVPKNPRFPVGKNVIVNKEETSIYALIDGQVSITERGKINVFSVYEVKGNVDFSTGNIDFVGSVLINGNILSGFTVKAKGDIRVRGNIEGAFIESDGSIEVAGGIIGYHKGSIKAKQNLKANFIQNAIVSVGNEIIVSDSIMHSNVSAGKSITLNGNKALIVGGLIRAGDEVYAKVIGNAMATPTDIQVGINPELRSELIEIRNKLKEIHENMGKSDQAITILNQLKETGRITPDKELMRIKLENSIQAMLKYKADGEIRIKEIEEILEDASLARVKCSNIIHPGVKLTIGKEVKIISDEVKRSVFYIKDGEITFMPL